MTKNKKDKKPKTINSLSRQFKDGRNAEAVLRTELNQTGYLLRKEPGFDEFIFEPVIFTNYKNEILESDEKASRVMLAFHAEHPIIKNKFVVLPSDLEDYDSIGSLHSEIKDFIARYVSLPENFYNVCASFVLMTWVYEKFNVLPYLRVIGHFGTGKSRFLHTIGNLCYLPMLAGGSISTAAVFRTLDLIKGTLIFDEADFRESDMKAEITKILNSGNQKGGTVSRMKPDNNDSFETEIFDVFGPKIIASREVFTDPALESRMYNSAAVSQKQSEGSHSSG